jgi:hypothetical protein
MRMYTSNKNALMPTKASFFINKITIFYSNFSFSVFPKAVCYAAISSVF